MSVIPLSFAGMADMRDFEQRGALGYWYRIGKPQGDPYEARECAGCGRPCLVRRRGDGRQGAFCSRECAIRGPHSKAWKGDGASYAQKHKRIRAQRGPASGCVWGCDSTRYEWAHNLGEIGTPDEYVSMCHRCHNRYDAAIGMMSKPVAGRTPARDGRWRPWATHRRAS